MAFHRCAVRAVASLLLASTLATPALAVTGTVDSGSDTLRVRAQSNTSSEVLTKLSDGTQVEVLTAVENGWYQIAYEGTTGYVSGQFLSIAEEELTALPVETLPVYVRITEGPLNVRSGPGTEYDKVDKLSTGRVLQTVATLDGWYQIEGGYISADYTEVVDASAMSQSGKGQEIADYALQYVGYPYVYGGSSPKGFDCSGFTSYVYKQFGYSINRTASNQLDNGVAVSMSELQPGDLVMFKKGSGGSRASHVGIYIGNSQFVHASTSKVGVIVSNMSDAYYTTGFVGGRRIV